MKRSLFILAGLFLPLSIKAQFIPTPEMAVKFSMGEDHRKWTAAYHQGNSAGFIYEFVPEGQTIAAWKEMVAQQITFTAQTLREYVDGWKARVSKDDPQIELKETAGDGNSVVVEYTSLAFHETAIRRFIKCDDGIYALAYHVRPELKNENEYAVWAGIIDTASVIPNPERSPGGALPAASPNKDGSQEAARFAAFLVSHAGKDFDPPPGATMNDLMKVLVSYTNAHPEFNGKLTDDQALQVLIDKYPPSPK
jgi:hypothetical protein